MTKTSTIERAMRALSKELQSDDGIANAACLEAADRLREMREQQDELLDILTDVVRQFSAVSDHPDVFDSQSLSVLADAMRILARHGRFAIDVDRGRRVIGRIVPRRSI